MTRDRFIAYFWIGKLPKLRVINFYYFEQALSHSRIKKRPLPFFFPLLLKKNFYIHLYRTELNNMTCIDMETVTVFRCGKYIVEWEKIHAYVDENELFIMDIPLRFFIRQFN